MNFVVENTLSKVQLACKFNKDEKRSEGEFNAFFEFSLLYYTEKYIYKEKV